MVFPVCTVRRPSRELVDRQDLGTPMLTEKQKELLVFINARLQETGVPPSFDEMKDALALQSKSGVHRLIIALEERGFIRRLPHRARAIEIIKLPEAMTDPGPQRRGFSPSVIEGSGRRQPQLSAPPPAYAQSGATVPLMGRIAAGVPISAIQDHTQDIGVPPDLVAGGEHFALEVKGDSMIDAGINEGDIIIVKRCDTADNGDIVVAGIPGEEATVKTFTTVGDRVVLQPANPRLSPMEFAPSDVRVFGRVVTVMRRL